jgi:hypothetical protein
VAEAGYTVTGFKEVAHGKTGAGVYEVDGLADREGWLTGVDTFMLVGEALELELEGGAWLNILIDGGDGHFVVSGEPYRKD